MSKQVQLGSNLDKQSQMSKPVVVPYINSLVGREQGVLRSKYYGSYDLDGYVNNMNLYSPQQLSSVHQMTGNPQRVKLPTKPMQNLNRQLDIPRINDPNKVADLYKKFYSDAKVAKASTSGTYDIYSTSNFPAKKYMK